MAGKPQGNSVLVDLQNVLLDPSGHIPGPPILDPLHNPDDIPRCYLVDVQVSDTGENILLQTTGDALAVTFRPARHSPL